MPAKPNLKTAKEDLNSSSDSELEIDQSVEHSSSNDDLSDELSEHSALDDSDDLIAESSGNEDHSDLSDDDESELSGTAEPQPKRTKKDDAFGSAMTAILGSKVKAYNSDNPVLIRNTKSAKEIEEDRQNRRARKALRAERLHNKDKARVKNVIPADIELAGQKLQHEKILKKVAQRGVIRLLNAIHHAQSAVVTDQPSSEKQASSLATDVSKEKFLDMIRMG